LLSSGINFDGTITLGNILTIISGFIAFLVVYSKMVRLLSIIEQFPPHRHVGNAILYPSGMEPGKIKEGNGRER
jgi:hypothetical protein